MHFGTYSDVQACVEYFADVLDGATAAVERFSRSDALLSVLQKQTSDGRLWRERLAGVTSQTKYHAYTVLESIRLERPRPNYRLSGENPPVFLT